MEAHLVLARGIVGLLVVHAGQTFTITLPSHRGGGYVWQLAYYDHQLVRFTGKSNGAPPRLIGPTADEVFHFKALDPGHLELRFQDVRPWEGPRAEDEVATRSVEILG